MHPKRIHQTRTNKRTSKKRNKAPKPPKIIVFYVRKEDEKDLIKRGLIMNPELDYQIYQSRIEKINLYDDGNECSIIKKRSSKIRLRLKDFFQKDSINTDELLQIDNHENV